MITKEEYIRLRQQGKSIEEIVKIANKPKASTGLKGFAEGVGQGILQTGFGAGKLGTGLARTLLPKFLEPSQTPYERPMPEGFIPQTTAQKVGFGAEKVAEFLLPSSKITALEKGVGLFGRAGIEAVIAGGTTAIQRGKIDQDTATVALIGAAFPLAGSVLSKGKQLLGSGTKATGQKIQQTVIRPQAADLRDGFKIENVNKYDVGGSVAETAAKVHVRLNKKAEELNNLLKGIKSGKLDLASAVRRTREALEGDKAISFGSNKAIRRQLKSLIGEIQEVVGKKTKTDLFSATQIKRGAGTKGAWAFGRLDPEADAVEKVYSTFYRVLKEDIEKQAGKLGPEIKAVNKEISELIPISNAALRRLPVDQRNNVISLTDGIGLFASVFDPKALAILGANKLSKSGKFGAFLAKFGKERLAPKTSIGARFFGP